MYSVRPELTGTLAVKAGRHPTREKIHAEKFVPNDVYATQRTRFQIITGKNLEGYRSALFGSADERWDLGCNMSGMLSLS